MASNASYVRNELRDGVSRKGQPLDTPEKYASRIGILQVHKNTLKDGRHKEVLMAEIASAEQKRAELEKKRAEQVHAACHHTRSAQEPSN